MYTGRHPLGSISSDEGNSLRSMLDAGVDATLGAVATLIEDGVRAGTLSQSDVTRLSLKLANLRERASGLEMVISAASVPGTNSTTGQIVGQIAPVRDAALALLTETNQANASALPRQAWKIGLWTLGGLALAGAAGFWVLHASGTRRRRRR